MAARQSARAPATVLPSLSTRGRRLRESATPGIRLLQCTRQAGARRRLGGRCIAAALGAVVVVAVCAMPLAADGNLARNLAQTPVPAPSVPVPPAELVLRVEVVDLDTARRVVVLRSAPNEIVTVDVPNSVKGFDQARIGDVLVLRYRASALAWLEPVQNDGVRGRQEATHRPGPAGTAAPGTVVTRATTVLTVLEAIDRQARTVTVGGAERPTTAQLAADIDMGALNVGQQVRATFVESLVLDVEQVGR